jgi:hypothetical protein
MNVGIYMNIRNSIGCANTCRKFSQQTVVRDDVYFSTNMGKFLQDHIESHPGLTSGLEDIDKLDFR